MSKRKDEQSSDKGKKRFLNIIYFIDSHKTRSFQLSLGQFNLIVFLGVGILVWALVTPFIIVTQSAKESLLRGRFQDSMATIFQYQSQYDDVFRMAYKIDGKQRGVLPMGGKAVSKSPQKLREDTARLESSISGEVDESIRSLVVKASTGSGSVSFQDPMLSRDGNQIQLDLIIKNEVNPAKATGHVWSVLHMVSSDDTRKTITSPSGLQSKGGKIDKAKLSDKNYFSIRYYKPKRFTFTIPDGWKGRIDKFEIKVLNQRGLLKETTISSREGQIHLDKITRFAARKVNEYDETNTKDKIE